MYHIWYASLCMYIYVCVQYNVIYNNIIYSLTSPSAGASGEAESMSSWGD